MNEASLGLLVAAVLVGFAAAWLVLEVRRAWSPEALHRTAASAGTYAAGPEGADDVTRLMPALVDEVTKLRVEIAAVRAAELEVALRNRHREILLAQAIKAGEERPAPLATAEPEPPVGEAPVEEELVDDTPVDNTPIEESPVGEAPVEHEAIDDTPDDDVEDEPEAHDADADKAAEDTVPDLTPGDIAALSAVATGVRL